MTETPATLEETTPCAHESTRVERVTTNDPRTPAFATTYQVLCNTCGMEVGQFQEHDY